jgi:Glycine zipper
MKQIIAILTVLAFLFAIMGCATTNPDGSPNTGKSAGLGALIGAAGGALLGYATTGKASGALAGAAIGAAVGGLTGFVIGKSREKEYKNAQQIYKENPSYAKESAKDEPPVVTRLEPYLIDSKGNYVNTVKNGEKVELGMKYDIVTPRYSDIQEVKVEETNYLVNSKGVKTENPELTRKKTRPKATGTDAAIEMYIPKNLPDGKYTHVAVVKLGDKKYEKDQQIQIVRSNDEIKIYAVNW